MIICNTENIPNKKYEIIGMTSGVGFVYGANIITHGASGIIHNAETQAITEMKQKAETVNADGLINIRFSMVTSNGIMILATGTMIKFVD